MLNRSVSLVIGQVIICGRVLDDDTELPIPGFSVLLFDRGVNSAVEIAPAQYHLSLRRTPDGLFGFFGDPDAIPLDKTANYQWRVDVSAPNYQTLQEEFQFGPLPAQPEPVEFIRPIPGDAFSVRLFSAGLPLDLGDLKPVKIPPP